MDDLLREFLTETNESLDVADTELVKFETDPGNREILNNIFRLVHTIKGTCGFIGLSRLAGLAHAAETLMDEFRNGRPITSGSVGLILSTIDRIKTLLAEIEQRDGTEPEGSDADLIAALEAEVARVPEPVAVPAAAPAPAPAPAATSIGAVIERLERELLPGEVPLAELDRVFRETDVEVRAPKPAASAARPVAAEAPAAAASHDSVSAQTIRVNLGTLEQLMTMVSELVLTRNQLLEISRRNEDSEYKVSLQRLSNVTGELQDIVMRTRMQPIGNAWQKLPRIVRDLAQDLGKQIELEQHGAETELDRQVLDQIKDPLTHMVRNSADHGLETPEARRAAGKPERGTIRLSAYHEGGHVILEIADDGRGLDVARIRAKAIENGLCTEAEAGRMPDAQLYRFIFHAGFSTAKAVTSVSGRGVGMDVVRNNIEAIGGTVDVRSKPGKGTTFVIKIPLTLAIVPALIVRAGEERFALPQTVVLELVRVREGSEHSIRRINGTPVLSLREQLLPIVDLGAALGVRRREAELVGNGREDALIAVMNVGAQQFGVVVDAVSHTEEIVVKPLASMLRHVSMVSGSTILGDGRVIMIVDPNGLAQLAAARAEKTADMDTVTAAEHGAEKNALTSLLLFRAGAQGIKAVPLSLVTRLEELDASNLEELDGRPVVQYRGTLIPVLYANAEVERRTSGRQPLLIFSEGTQTIGLVVDEIVDIVETELRLQLSPATPELIGGAIINGIATEVYDVGHFMGAAFGGDLQVTPHFEGRAHRLLLVDENAFLRALLEPLLRGHGYRVITCRTAREALDRLSADRDFAAVVSGVGADDVDGFHLAEAIRNELGLEDLPIIGVASTSRPELIERGREAGFTDYVAKFDRPGLMAALREFASNEHLEAA
ncbi:chemotaxis protein CheW [Prosthecomicrobium pneumaticum]|uniref:Chemotaxis protein CheA n=1 Tax=Prosthecomicrobium pneumaticum TaxID=81895 RepID=A0A7W9CST3_9HYPH|nr:chemotaxis protein CheW [Prosthecomicrobium pneumaticum]MBB5751051.1 two-component system chemotaxis sensor kinase CheA [Prosthecomicrobium pneumaticum]